MLNEFTNRGSTAGDFIADLRLVQRFRGKWEPRCSSAFDENHRFITESVASPPSPGPVAHHESDSTICSVLHSSPSSVLSAVAVLSGRSSRVGTYGRDFSNGGSISRTESFGAVVATPGSHFATLISPFATPISPRRSSAIVFSVLLSFQCCPFGRMPVTNRRTVPPRRSSASMPGTSSRRESAPEEYSTGKW